jgi:hypothetical protein
MVTLMRQRDDVGLLVMMSLMFNSPVSYIKPFHIFLTAFADVVCYYSTIL